MDEVTILPHLTALGIAYLLAIPIAWDREKEDRSAGLRTFPLVAIATCGFIERTENFLRGSPEAQARVIEGLTTRVGFIGGGAILKHGASVHGTATAASLWATGAVGVASAFGAYEVAGLIAVVTFLTLRYLLPLKEKRPRTASLIELDDSHGASFPESGSHARGRGALAKYRALAVPCHCYRPCYCEKLMAR
ncbi:MAG: MgtC/SapB family protein [Stellaceae bacterium]